MEPDACLQRRKDWKSHEVKRTFHKYLLWHDHYSSQREWPKNKLHSVSMGAKNVMAELETWDPCCMG